MKYALMIYQENNSHWRNGEVYMPDKVNIGDYVQSIAARQFLPQVDVFINRENIKEYTGEPVKMIMNGWWRIFDSNEYPSENIIPLYVSIHFNHPEEITDSTIQALKKYEPIGCRDMATCRFLQSRNVDAYFSSCLTTTLGNTYFVPQDQRGDEVLFADFAYKDEGSWISRLLHRKYRNNRQINKLVKKIVGKDANPIFIEHSLDIRNLPEENRFQIADSYLKRYARAKLVVTSRIHCALPCLAMGVPVLLVFYKYDSGRYEKLIDMLNYIGIKDNKVISNYNLVPAGKGWTLQNSDKYKEYAQKLMDRIRSFIVEE